MCLQKEISTRVRGALRCVLIADTRGVELVEFAMVVLILFFLIIGIFWIGRAVSVYQALGRAAREGARVALAPTCATCGNGTSDPTTTINTVLTAASLNPGLATPTVSLQQQLDPSDPTNYQVYAVTVTVQYPLQFGIPFLPNGGALSLSSSATMRQEY